MNKIDDIIDKWNAKLEEFYSNDILVNGLVTPIVRRDESDVYYPVIIDKEGNNRYVFTDDRTNIGVYHKLLNKTYQSNPNASFGNNVRQDVTADMLLIFWGFITKYPKAHQVESRISSLAPKGVTIRISNFDRFNVFHQEFGNIPFFLPQNVFLFSIKYQISYKLNSKCVNG